MHLGRAEGGEVSPHRDSRELGTTGSLLGAEELRSLRCPTRSAAEGFAARSARPLDCASVRHKVARCELTYMIATAFTGSSLLSAPGTVPWRKRSIAPREPSQHRHPASNRHRHPSMPAAERVSPRASGASWTGMPSMNVATTRASPMAPAPRSNRSRSRTTRSAALPTSREPTSSSRWLTKAEPVGERRERVDQVQPLVGQEWRIARHVVVGDPVDGHLHLEQRVGASRRPVGAHRERRAGRQQRAERVLPAVRSGPRSGIVRSSIWASWHAQYGWALAVTPSSRNRADVVGMDHLDVGDVRPRVGRAVRRRAAATASSASRTARSPIAWKCGWNPRASSLVTYA